MLLDDCITLHVTDFVSYFFLGFAVELSVSDILFIFKTCWYVLEIGTKIYTFKRIVLILCTIY